MPHKGRKPYIYPQAIHNDLMAGQGKRRIFYWLTGILLLLLLMSGIKLAGYIKQKKSGHFEGNYLSLCYLPDSVLGYAPFKDTVIKSIKIFGADTIYDSYYILTSQGLRESSCTKIHCGSYHALFFGCSFVYGEGLNAENTIPYIFNCRNKEIATYNFGYSGYGPQQMLARLQKGVDTVDIPPKGLAIYTLLPEHVHRAIGSMHVHNQWGAHMPYYVVENDSLVRKGDFTSGRPFTSAWYRLLGIMGISPLLPDPKITLKDIDLTSRIITESKKLYLKQFPGSRFYVMMYPVSGMKMEGDQLVTSIKNRGVEVLDYRSLFEMDSLHTIKGDGHPNGLANKIIAEQLMKDLGEPISDMQFDPLVK